MLVLLAALLVLGCVPWAAGQEKRPTMAAVLVRDGAIRIDGRAGEAEWLLASPATDFVQSVPDTRKPSSEKTEVRVLYDSTNLYFGARCFVKDPGTIRYYEFFRDFGVYNTDTFEVALDTFHDKRNCVAFATNPLGAMLDLEYSNNGAASNRNWDAAWQVRTAIDEDGFFVEMAIPFRSLRYPHKSGEQVWGINFQRRIRHRSEQAFWAFVPRPFSISRVTLAGTLTGLHDLPRARNVKATPYVRSGFSSKPDASEPDGRKTKPDVDAGLDVKYGIGNAMTADLTVRPDFSNVDADVQQVNLTRFDLFYPEKRPFFLERYTTFDIRRTRRGNGVAGGGTSSSTLDLIPFFTRTIGLSAAGQPVPVLAGGRLTGQVEGGFDVGVLFTRTGDYGGRPGEDFGVVRVRKKVLSNSDLGFIYTDRRTAGAADYNRLVGTDLHFQLARYLDISGLLMTTRDSRGGTDRMAYSVAASWRDSLWDWNLGYLDIDRDFTPGMGFVPRRGIKKTTADFSIHPRLDRWSIREYAPYITNDYISDQQNSIATRQRNVGMQLLFLNGATFDFSRRTYFDRLMVPFSPGRGVVFAAGDYNYSSWAAEYKSDISRRISGSIGMETGDFYGGTKTTYTGSTVLHPDEHLTTSVSYSRNIVDGIASGFTTNLVGLRVDYGFGPTMFFNAFIQYNSLARQVNTILRFNLIHHPLSNLFVTYSELRNTADSLRLDRVLALKFTQMVQF